MTPEWNSQVSQALSSPHKMRKCKQSSKEVCEGIYFMGLGISYIWVLPDS